MSRRDEHRSLKETLLYESCKHLDEDYPDLALDLAVDWLVNHKAWHAQDDAKIKKLQATLRQTLEVNCGGSRCDWPQHLLDDPDYGLTGEDE